VVTTRTSLVVPLELPLPDPASSTIETALIGDAGLADLGSAVLGEFRGGDGGGVPVRLIRCRCDGAARRVSRIDHGSDTWLINFRINSVLRVTSCACSLVEADDKLPVPVFEKSGSAL